MRSELGVGAERAGDDIHKAMVEAHRQSDDALTKIGGADVWSGVKNEGARAGESIERSMREAETSSNRHLDGIKTNGVNAFRLIGSAAAAIGGVALFKEAISQASDLNESVNAVNVMFGDAAAGIHALGGAAATDLGLTEGQFNGLAVSFGAFAKTIAGPGGDVAKTMDDLTKRGADFASVMNLQVADAATLFQSGLAGETEPLRKFGIDLSAASVQAYAVRTGLIAAGDTMTEQQKVQARYGSLMEQTNKVQGDFKNTSGELANGMRILKANTLETAATFGAAFLPALKNVVGGLNQTVTALATPLAGLGTSLGAAIQPLMDAIGPVVGIIITQLSKVVTDIGSMIGSVAPLLSPVVQIIGVLATALSGTLATAFHALQPAISAVAKFLDVFADHLGGALMDALDAVTPLLTMIGNLLGGVLSAVLPTVIQLFDTLVPPLLQIAAVVSDVLLATLPGLADAFIAIVNAILPLVGAGLEFVLTAVAEALQTLSPILPTIIDAFLIWKTYTIAMNAVLFIFNAVLAANPIVLVGIAIAALVVGVIYAYNHFQVFHDVVDQAWQIMQKVWDYVTNVFIGAWHLLRDAISTVTGFLQAFWDKTEGLRGFLADVFSAAFNLYVKIPFELAKGAVDLLSTTIKWLWDNVLSPLIPWISGTFAVGIGVAKTVLGDLRNAFQFVIDKVDWLIRRAQFLIDLIPNLSPLGGSGLAGKFNAANNLGGNTNPAVNARGAIVTTPTLGWSGDAGPEAIIPMTNPSRALELLGASGLGDLWARQHATASAPIVNIERATFQNATDADLVAQRTHAAVTSLLLSA